MDSESTSRYGFRCETINELASFHLDGMISTLWLDRLMEFVRAVVKDGKALDRGGR